MRSHTLKFSLPEPADLKSCPQKPSYGRLMMSDTLGTLTTIVKVQNGGSPGPIFHPFLNRPITPREAARAQGFPDAYSFSQAKKESISMSCACPSALLLGVESHSFRAAPLSTSSSVRYSFAASSLGVANAAFFSAGNAVPPTLAFAIGRQLQDQHIEQELR